MSLESDVYDSLPGKTGYDASHTAKKAEEEPAMTVFL